MKFVAARVAVLVLVVVPVVAWFVVKPVHVLAPQWASVICDAEKLVCVDEAARQGEARDLRDEAVRFVSGKVGKFNGHPRVVFCASQACADSFGLGARSAVTLGTFGTVIGPRAWKPYYVRHELIHYLQAERVGIVHLLFKPQWWIEGMAYALSEDPREKLMEPWETDRAAFKKWLGGAGEQKLWESDQAP